MTNMRYVHNIYIFQYKIVFFLNIPFDFLLLLFVSITLLLVSILRGCTDSEAPADGRLMAPTSCHLIFITCPVPFQHSQPTFLKKIEGRGAKNGLSYILNSWSILLKVMCLTLLIKTRSHVCVSFCDLITISQARY